MKQKLKYILGLVIVMICLTAFSKPIFEKYTNTDTVLNKIGCRLFEFNTISIRAHDNLDLQQVQVKINKRTVFKNGHQQNKIGQDYGHNIFEVFYANLLIAEVGHFRTNNWFTNQYTLEISNKGTDLIVEHLISGPDAKNDNFQKRYIYQHLNKLIRIDYLNENGQVYNIEKFK